MHEFTSSMPVRLEGGETSLRAMTGWDGMAVAYAELPAGTDLGPLLKGLPADVCGCPHWGYLLSGRITVGYSDGSAEEIVAGQVFYLPSGHTAKIEEDAAFVEFSPESDYVPVLEHVLAQAGAGG